MRTSPSLSAARRNTAGMMRGALRATRPGQDSVISGLAGGAAPCAAARRGTRPEVINRQIRSETGRAIWVSAISRPSCIAQMDARANPRRGNGAWHRERANENPLRTWRRGFWRIGGRKVSVPQARHSQRRALLADRLDVEQMAALGARE